MNDLISRQSAIDAVDVKNVNKGIVSALQSIIEELPSVQQWTPVSEGLPEDLKAVNVTWINRETEKYYEFIKDVPMVDTAVFFKGRWFWWSAYCIDVLGEYGYDEADEIDDRIEVKAWMPLPEPYRGG